MAAVLSASVCITSIRMDFTNDDDLLDEELEEGLGPITEYNESLIEDEEEALLLQDNISLKPEDEWKGQSLEEDDSEWFHEELDTKISITGKAVSEDVLDIDIKDQEFDASDTKEEPEIVPAAVEDNVEENDVAITHNVNAESETEDVQEDEEPSERGKFVVERPSPVQNDFLPRKRTKFMPHNQNRYGNQTIRPPFSNRNRPHFNNRNGPMNNFPAPPNVNNSDLRFHNNMRPQFRPPFNSVRANATHFVQNPPFMPRGHPQFFRGPMPFPPQNQNIPMNAVPHFRPNGSNFNNQFHPPGGQGFRQPFPIHPPGNVEQYHNQHFHPPPPRANSQFVDNMIKNNPIPNTRTFIPLSINNPQIPPLHSNLSGGPPMQDSPMINNFNNPNIVHRNVNAVVGYEQDGSITRPISNHQPIKKTEQRTVLINPHFKGKVTVQNARLIWDLQHPHLNTNEPNLTYARNASNNDDELLRQQEEFINQNRRNLQKRMSQQQQYDRDSPDHINRRPSPHRHFKSFATNKNRTNEVTSRNDYGRKRFPLKRNESLPDSNNHNVVVEEPEDEETRAYRAKIEEQKRVREDFLRTKEERRKLRQAAESANQENLETDIKMDTNDIISSSSDYVVEQPEINDRLAKINKGVQKTGIINLKTGVITQKKHAAINRSVPDAASDIALRESVVPNDDFHKSKMTVTNPTSIVRTITSGSAIKNVTNAIPKSVATMTEESNLDDKTPSIGNNKSSGSAAANINITRTVNIGPTGQTVISTSLNNKQQHNSSSNQCKSGFLGRRMVIASNTDKSHIIVKATHLIENQSTNTGIFRKIIANQVEDEA